MAQGGAIATTVPENEIDEPEDELLPVEPAENGRDDDPEALHAAAIEERAYRQGWRPIDQYRGEPGKWIDADTFLKRGENFLPFVQKQLRDANDRSTRLETEVTALRGELEESRLVVREVRQFALRANQAGYERARAEIEAERRQAVETGDVVAYDHAGEKLKALDDGHREQTEVAPVVEEPPPPRPDPKVKVAQEVQDFVAANPWFNTDQALNSAMQGYHMTLRASKPGLTLAQNLAEAKRRVIADFPEKFGEEEHALAHEPQPRRPASPLPPTPPRQRGTQRTGFDRIADAGERDEAKAGYARMKRQDPDLTVDEYVTLYEDPRADVIAMREAAKKKGAK